RMKLHELHVNQFRAGMICQRLPVARVFPGVAGDFIGATNAAGGEHDGFRLENLETSTLAVVAERSNNSVAVLEQRDDRVLHVDFDALMDAVVLERANQFQAGAVADMGESRIAVTAEIALKNSPIGSAIQHRAPGLELADAVGGFLCMEFGHAPVVDVL